MPENTEKVLEKTMNAAGVTPPVSSYSTRELGEVNLGATGLNHPVRSYSRTVLQEAQEVRGADLTATRGVNPPRNSESHVDESFAAKILKERKVASASNRGRN